MKRALISILSRIKGNVNANAPLAALTEIKKFFTTDGETRVFVSGRCVKYCIKQRLAEKGYDLSKLSRVERVLQPEGNPVDYIDDDLFGYLIPQEERLRFAPLKTDGIVALRHCEIIRDFACRYDPEMKEYPSPYEVEVADFIGQNNWILTENIGKFRERGLNKEILEKCDEKLEKREEDGKDFYYLKNGNKGRRDRLEDFLEVLLKERYTFPRSATGLHMPDYYYAVILTSERLLPLSSHVDYQITEGKVSLNIEKIKRFCDLLKEGEKVTVIDFEKVMKVKEFEEKVNSLGVYDISQIDKVIEDICSYLIR